MVTFRRPLEVAVCLAILAAHVVLSLDSSRQNSVCVDEGGHLWSGIRVLRYGDTQYYRVNPPLIKILAALPIVLSSPAYPRNDLPAAQVDDVVEQFFSLNGERFHSLILRARAVILGFSVFASLLLYFWCRASHGPAAAISAVVLWCFNPDVLAWSGVATVDIGAAAMALLAVIGIRNYMQTPCSRTALLAGLLLGLAQLSKFTLLSLLPVWLWACLSRVWPILAAETPPSPPRPFNARAAQFCLHAALSSLVIVFVINAGYAFRGTFRPLDSFSFQCRFLTRPAVRGVETIEERLARLDRGYYERNRFRGTWLASFPVPFPADYIFGLDEQKARVDNGLGLPTFLAGKWYRNGHPLFFFVAWLCKLPLTLLAALFLSFLITLLNRRTHDLRRAALWFIPLAAIFGTITLQTGLGVYSSTRYVLPALPFLVVAAGPGVGGIAALILRKCGVPETSRANSTIVALLTGACLLSSAIEAAMDHPHYISFFNAAAPFSRSGLPPLLEANVDWGQDMLRLSRWLRRHPECQPVTMLLRTGVDPRLYGIQCEDARPAAHALKTHALKNREAAKLPSGYYAVGVSQMLGMKVDAYSANGEHVYFRHGECIPFQQMHPVAMIGRSIYIFYVSSDELIPRGHLALRVAVPTIIRDGLVACRTGGWLSAFLSRFFGGSGLCTIRSRVDLATVSSKAPRAADADSGQRIRRRSVHCLVQFQRHCLSVPNISVKYFTFRKGGCLTSRIHCAVARSVFPSSWCI